LYNIDTTASSRFYVAAAALLATGQGGVTGMLLLTESHLACHTFPERGYASFNLYCCRPRDEWPWPERLAESLGARRVEVRSFMRGRP
jgi:S-adenosylmethionine decarboxylase